MSNTTTTNRFRRVENWVEGQDISDHQKNVIGQRANECRGLEKRVILDTTEISERMAKFVLKVKETGSLTSPPTNYRDYTDLPVLIAKFESKVAELMALVYVVFGQEGKDTVRDLLK